MPDSPWFSQTSEQVLRHFQSTAEGLSAEAAGEHRQRYGDNVLPGKKPDSLGAIFLRQFQSPLIYVLAIAGILILFIDEYTDAFIVFFVLFFNAVIGTVQEGKAQNTLASLADLVETTATVMRDGAEEIIPDTEVVAGDLLVLHEGDKIPADARIVLARNLALDESSLTGESQPAYKMEGPLGGGDLPPAEQKNMVFKGTHIVSGAGTAVVTATGTRTVIGGISQSIAAIESEDPIKRDIRALSKIIVIAVIAVCAALLVGGLAAGKEFGEMLVTVISLSVSVIPEGLPVVMTLVLATGVWRMSKKNALVKKLQAVESLGQASVIAVDKTGTITKNELAVTAAYAGGALFSVEGSGYEPAGSVTLDGAPAGLSDARLAALARAAVSCADAHVAFSEEKRLWQVSGDPTEAALLVFGEKLGLNKLEFAKTSAQLAEIPFSYQTKYHATLHEAEGGRVITVIGAPETVIKLSSLAWGERKNSEISPAWREDMEQAVSRMSSQGLRVLGVAVRKTPADSLAPEDITDLAFVGLIGMKDVLRNGVRDALARAHEAGMKVVMITGDHKLTAQAIAEEAGIFGPGSKALSGGDIEDLSDEALAQIVGDAAVFARVTPEHKLRIIRAYQARGDIIAMTGDGVNDAPSLVAADLGVAMGKIGTEVAKEASDIVLLDDNFGSIVAAVEEGRSIYKTIKKVILYLLSTNIGEVFTITGALCLGLPLPVLASQIIWLNFVTDGFLDVSLALEPKEDGLLKERRVRQRGFIDGLMARRMALMALPMAAGSLWLFGHSLHLGLAKAQTIALTALAAFQWFNAWNCRSEKKSVFAMSPWSNPYLLGSTALVVALQLLAVYSPLLQRYLHTEPLNAGDWLLIAAVALTIVAIEEIRKLLARRR